jgi:hypothetical protein
MLAARRPKQRIIASILTPNAASAVEMPGRGLEPLRISPPDPKSGASANFATLAIGFPIVDFGLAIANCVGVANWIQLTTYAHQVPLKTTRTVAMACSERMARRWPRLLSFSRRLRLQQ